MKVSLLLLLFAITRIYLWRWEVVSTSGDAVATGPAAPLEQVDFRFRPRLALNVTLPSEVELQALFDARPPPLVVEQRDVPAPICAGFVESVPALVVAVACAPELPPPVCSEPPRAGALTALLAFVAACSFAAGAKHAAKAHPAPPKIAVLDAPRYAPATAASTQAPAAAAACEAFESACSQPQCGEQGGAEMVPNHANDDCGRARGWRRTADGRMSLVAA
jgi:hypothetical protein